MSENKYTLRLIAELCHNVNKAYCEAIGENQPTWEESPREIQESAIMGVLFHLSNDYTPEQSHENWMKEKEENGWTWGYYKDFDKKEHPCMVPYDELPLEQKVKDYLFKSVVDTFKSKEGKN